jgi:nitrite reductase (NADH) small subunit
MAGKRILCRLADVPPGEGRSFEMDGRRIAVFHTRAGGVFATGATCPHRQGPLAEGLVGDRTVICPLHERVYDLGTGRELTGECDIAVYPVQTTEDGLVVLQMAMAG